MVYKARAGRARVGEKGSFMLSDLTGRRPTLKAVTRGGLLTVGIVLGLGLSACTTTEGTNAMTDVGTFEREVLTETMKGMGMMEREEKPETPERRGPLVLPKSTALPPPADPKAAKTALIPEDSSRVQIDTSNISEADLKRLRNARVVDLRTLSGRPLTEAALSAARRVLYYGEGPGHGLPRRQWRARAAHRQVVPAGGPQGPSRAGELISTRKMRRP